MNASSRYSR